MTVPPAVQTVSITRSVSAESFEAFHAINVTHFTKSETSQISIFVITFKIPSTILSWLLYLH